MKRLIWVLILAGVVLLDYSYSSSIFPREGLSLFPPDIYSKPKNKNLYEDFDGKFDLSWDVLGFDPSHISIGKVPGSLTLTSQSGSFETVYKDYKNVFLVDFPAEQTDDFQITTCISNFKPSKIWNQAGLVLWNDKDNFLKFVYEYGRDTPNGEGLLFTVGCEIGARANYAWFLAEQTPQKMWLRIVKRGDIYELLNSTDGKNFNPVKAFRVSSLAKDNTVPCLTVPLKSIGIFTSNYTSATAPDVDASFDFFEFKVLSEESKMPAYPSI